MRRRTLQFKEAGVNEVVYWEGKAPEGALGRLSMLVFMLDSFVPCLNSLKSRMN